MSTIQIGLAILIAIYALVGIAMYVYVQKSGRRFIIAGKRLPLFLVGTMLFAQAVDANSTLGSTGGVYVGGFWFGFTFPLGLALCLIVVGTWFAKPLNRMNLITLADFYYRRYNNTVEIIVSLIMAVSFIILVAGNLAGCAWIVHVVFGFDYVLSLLIISAIVLAYTFSGGLFSCAATDIVQLYPAFLAFVAAPLILIATFGWAYFADAIPPEFIDLSGLTAIENGALVNWAGILALAIGDIVALDFMERVFSAKDPETAQKSCFYASFFTIVIGISAAMMGLMALKLFPGLTDTRDALPLLAMNHLPFVVGLFIMGGVIGAGLSTANGGALAVSAVFGRNLLQRNILLPMHRRKAAEQGISIEELDVDWQAQDNRLLWYARFMLIPVFAMAMFLAYVKPEPGVMLVLAFDVVFAGCLVPLVLGLFWSKANAYGALAAVVIGSILRLVLFFTIPAEWAGLDTLIPPIISLAVMVPVSLATQRQDEPKHHVIGEIPSDAEVARALA